MIIKTKMVTKKHFKKRKKEKKITDLLEDQDLHG